MNRLGCCTPKRTIGFRYERHKSEVQPCSRRFDTGPAAWIVALAAADY